MNSGARNNRICKSLGFCICKMETDIKKSGKNALPAVTQLALSLVLHPALFSNADRLLFLSSERGGWAWGRVAQSGEMFMTEGARVSPSDSDARWMTAAGGVKPQLGPGQICITHPDLRYSQLGGGTCRVA